jgi:hypothetical protein
MALRSVFQSRNVRALSLLVLTLLFLHNQIQSPSLSLTTFLSNVDAISQTGIAIPVSVSASVSQPGAIPVTVSKSVSVSASPTVHGNDNRTSNDEISPSIHVHQTEQHKAANYYEESIQSLRNSTLKYYVYDDPQISREGADFPAIRVDEEVYVFHPFLHTNTPWRVTDPDLADLFIVPVPIYSHGHWLGAIRRMMQRLTRHPIFVKRQGNRHVIFPLDGRYFDVGNSTLNPLCRRFNEKWAPILVNATIVMNYDLITCKNLHEDNRDYGDWNDYFANVKPVLKYTFSIGLVAGSTLPVIPATYERFQTRNYTLFYHTRTDPFDFGSTPYRWAPINITLPYKATIGYELPPDQWIQRFTSSKFCLVIRGDTPNSHALLRAVKVGCIPVVVCDYYAIFSPTFKTSLDIRDFSIFLDEKAFLENPQEQLSSLEGISEVDIRKKLVALRYAQQVTCPDHPDSLFIPALLREADASFLPSYEH